MIPPRPWRFVEVADRAAVIRDAHEECFLGNLLGDDQLAAGQLIVRLVNAEAEIIAALEAAARIEQPLGSCDCGECQGPLDRARDLAIASLKMVRP